MTEDPNGIGMAKKLGSSENICLSGGAAGADVTWGEAAEQAGHLVVHWSFEGHSAKTKKHIYKLNDEELMEADEHLKQANKFLKRNLPFKKLWLINLLRRNWYQVKYVDALYAVGTLNERAVIYENSPGIYYKDLECTQDRMGVNGGTAWACQMYFGRWVEDRETFDPGDKAFSSNWSDLFPPFRLIFYEQETQDILFWSPIGRHWIKLDFNMNFPAKHKPKGSYAAIGTRKLNDHGKAFIDKMFS